MVKTLSRWKIQLDGATSFATAEEVMAQAFAQGTRRELIELLGDLYEEFEGPDPKGGSSGTLERMRLIVRALAPTDDELGSVEVNPTTLHTYLIH